VDALDVKCREGDRAVNACVVHAVADNRDGFRQSFGLDVVTQAALPGSPSFACRPRPLDS